MYTHKLLGSHIATCGEHVEKSLCPYYNLCYISHSTTNRNQKQAISLYIYPANYYPAINCNIKKVLSPCIRIYQRCSKLGHNLCHVFLFAKVEKTITLQLVL